MGKFVRTCGVGQPGHVCGLRAIGMVAVQSFRDVFTEVPLTPGIVYLCKRHYYDPILDPPEPPSSPASETEAVACTPESSDAKSRAGGRYTMAFADLTADLHEARATIERIRAIVTDSGAALVVDRIRAVLEEAGEAACRARHPAGKALPGASPERVFTWSVADERRGYTDDITVSLRAAHQAAFDRRSQ